MYGQELAYTGAAGAAAFGIMQGGIALAFIGVGMLLLAVAQLVRKPGKIKP